MTKDDGEQVWSQVLRNLTLLFHFISDIAKFILTNDIELLQLLLLISTADSTLYFINYLLLIAHFFINYLLSVMHTTSSTIYC